MDLALKLKFLITDVTQPLRIGASKPVLSEAEGLALTGEAGFDSGSKLRISDLKPKQVLN